MDELWAKIEELHDLLEINESVYKELKKIYDKLKGGS